MGVSVFFFNNTLVLFPLFITPGKIDNNSNFGYWSLIHLHSRIYFILSMKSINGALIHLFNFYFSQHTYNRESILIEYEKLHGALMYFLIFMVHAFFIFLCSNWTIKKMHQCTPQYFLYFYHYFSLSFIHIQF